MRENFPVLAPERKGRSKFEGLLRILRKSIMVTVMGLAASQSPESRLGAYIGHASETKIERLEKNKEFKPVKVRDIQRMVLQDNFERIFLGSKDNLYEVAGGQKESGFIEFKDIQYVIDQGEKAPIVGHTHPLSAYDNVGHTVEDIDKMRSGRSLPLPMPPSLTDIMGSVSTVEHFASQNIEVRGRVYDPTGMWEYKVQPDSAAVKLLNEFQRNLTNAVEASLTDSDRQIMEELKLDSIHPFKRIAILKSNPETLAIANKLERIADEYLNSLPAESTAVLEKFGELEILCVTIAGVEKFGYDYQQIQNLIAEYIQTARTVGIQVSYQNTLK